MRDWGPGVHPPGRSEPLLPASPLRMPVSPCGAPKALCPTIKLPTGGSSHLYRTQGLQNALEFLCGQRRNLSNAGIFSKTSNADLNENSQLMPNSNQLCAGTMKNHGRKKSAKNLGSLCETPIYLAIFPWTFN